jgi:hypothetical protein
MGGWIMDSESFLSSDKLLHVRHPPSRWSDVGSSWLERKPLYIYALLPRQSTVAFSG